jgi:hypothetical protein
MVYAAQRARCLMNPDQSLSLAKAGIGSRWPSRSSVSLPDEDKIRGTSKEDTMGNKYKSMGEGKRRLLAKSLFQRGQVAAVLGFRL